MSAPRPARFEAAELVVAGGGPHEWVWAAVAAGDVSVVRAAPATFDVRGVHPRYGNVLTAFLQGLLNLEGRFVADTDRARRALDLVEELGRRGARPDTIIPCANLRIKGLYQDWRLTGDVTALQALIQMRNDLWSYKFESAGQTHTDEDDAGGDAQILSRLIDRYAEIAARNDVRAPRSLIPDAVINIWEQCLADKTCADVDIVCPDGRASAHSLLLMRASDVMAAMLTSSMREGARREVHVQEPVRVVDLFLAFLYTGCVPSEATDQAAQKGSAAEVSVGLRVRVVEAFMSNSTKSVLLPAGLAGEVCVMDCAGDALVRFDNVPARQWVFRKNFWRLSSGAVAGAVQRYEDVASALALAHRWQVTGLAEVLEERLERGLSAETLPTTLEVAELHGAARLRAVCCAFAQNSGAVRAAFEEGSYNPAVLAALSQVYGRSSRKRARESL